MASPTFPHVDAVTVSRFVLDDFPLTERELEAVADMNVRYTLDDALREVCDFAAVGARAVELWRERRGA